MPAYPGFENGAKTNLSSYSWISITPSGAGQLFCYDGSNKLLIDLHLDDLIPLGFALLTARDGKRYSLIRKNGNLLTIDYSSSNREDIVLRTEGDTWGKLEKKSVDHLFDFILAVLKQVAIIPISVTIFSFSQINAVINKSK